MDKPWQYGVGGLQQPGGQTIYGGVAVGPPLARLMDAKFMIRALLLVLVVAIAVFVGLYFIGHGRPHDLGHLTFPFNGRAAPPLAAAAPPGWEETTSGYQTAGSMGTLTRDEPVIPGVTFLSCPAPTGGGTSVL